MAQTRVRLTLARAGEGFRLLTTVDESGVVIPQGKSLTLDLNGNVITSDVNTVTVRGVLTVVDTSGAQTGAIYGNSAVTVEQGGKFYMRSGMLEVTETSNEVVSIYDGEFISFGGKVGYPSHIYPLYITAHNENSKATIHDGLFYRVAFQEQEGGEITLYGGTYMEVYDPKSYDPKIGPTFSPYLAPSYDWSRDTTHTPAKYVVKFTGIKVAQTIVDGVEIYFANMRDAVEIAPDGAVITILQDLKGEYIGKPVIPAGKSLTIDFNGHRWISENALRKWTTTSLKVYGSLKVIGAGSSSFKVSTDSYLLPFDEGIVIGDGGRLDIEGVDFFTGIKMDSANSQLFFTGGEITGKLNNDVGGTVALYGGSFIASQASVWYLDSWLPYVAPGYEMVQESSSGYYKVQPKAGTVAMVGDESGYADGGVLSIVEGPAADAALGAWNGALALADAAVKANFAAWCEKFDVADVDALTEADADCFLLGFAPGSEVGDIKTDIELIDAKVKISFAVSAIEPGGAEVTHSSDDLSDFNGVVYMRKAESLDEILEAAGIKFEGQEFDQESPSCFYRIGVDFKLP